MFFALGMGMLAPARVEVITQVICAQINRDTAAHLPAFPDGVFLATPEQCRKSPAVQRRLSELNLMLQLAMGSKSPCFHNVYRTLSIIPSLRDDFNANLGRALRSRGSQVDHYTQHGVLLLRHRGHAGRVRQSRYHTLSMASALPAL